MTLIQLSTVVSLFCTLLSVRAEEAPTVMTQRGRLLVDQPLNAAIPPFDGRSKGFASGFSGWRWNAVPRGGRWEVADGAFVGRETADVKHPATASYGFEFKDAVIECELRMHDVPMAGRPSRFMMVRTTDTKDYVCSVHVSPTGFRITKDDNDHAGPDKSVVLGQVKVPLPLNQWHRVVLEVVGDEMTATVNGQSLTGKHQLIASAKHSVMFVVGGEGSVRNFKVWEATLSPGWDDRRSRIQGQIR